MHLEGSCHCGAVTFSVEAHSPVPYMHCYCSICRKTAGGGGYAINLGADYGTLKVVGKENISTYRARLDRTEFGKDEPNASRKKSSARRTFCKKCGSALWVHSPDWPDLVHPFASAIDTELPVPPDRNHLMLDFKASWVPVHADSQDHSYGRYPDETIAEWHERRGLS